MLHILEPPREATSVLRWVVGLQERLLRGLCDPQTTPASVTVAWVQGLWNDTSAAWVKKFCGRKGLELMRQLAAADSKEKPALLEGFLTDVDSLRTFQPGPQGLRFHGLACCGGNVALRDTVKDLFRMFYSPHLGPRAGYPYPGLRGGRNTFDRRAFVQEFLLENVDLGVCPYCDGTMDPGVVEVDHFYPEAEYPFFVVMPENLVPVCPRCNDLRVKGAKVPLDPGAADETADWFHPYYRSAAHQFTVAFLPPRTANRPRQVRLVGADPATQRRLDNLDTLLDITRFWASALKSQVTHKKNLLRTRRRKIGRALSEAELRAQFGEHADAAREGKRHMPFALLEEAFCRAIAKGDTQFLEEFAAVNSEPL